MIKGNEYYIWDHGIINTGYGVRRAERVWDLPDQVVYDTKIYTHIFYKKTRTFSLNGRVNTCLTASYNNCLYILKNHVLTVHDNIKDQYAAFCKKTAATTIEDAITLFCDDTTVKPEMIVYPKLIYDKLHPTYKVNRNKYCDMIFWTED